jgi:hypothetical protein
MATDLLIVSRQQPSLYDYLKEDFADDDSVHVVLDRRFGERRRTLAPVGADRRQAQRRRYPDLRDKLASLGFAVVHLE